jgi:ferredoxin
MMTITLTNRDNARYKVMGRRSLLHELREHGVDLPYVCRYGGCITCAAKLIESTLDQSAQVAFNNRQIDNGYIILCVAGAKTDCSIDIGMESHDLLYRNPFREPLAPQDLRAEVGAPKEA